MRRRSFLRTGLAAGGFAAACAAGRRAPLRELLAQGAPAERPVKRVLLIAKCHLDVGFIQTQAQVMRKYFEVYFPLAMQTAEQMRATGDRYVWTTGSWLLYEYLEQASAAERKEVEAAIARGDIDWHALPFNWQTEMIDRSMVNGAMGFSKTLDQRFGHTTTGAKMTDVPGHARGIIAPLEAAGVRMLDVGVNAASTPPDVPDVFLWKDPQGHSLAMLYHRHDYGSTLEIPGTDVAIAVEVRTDNSGPHTPAEIHATYARLRAQYPGATITACGLSAAATEIDRVRDRLPVVTEEIGDTWIYGVASDPVKVSRYREVARLRKAWIAQGQFATADATDLALLRRLLLAPEHTWGTDTKSYVDDDHYRPADLDKVLGQKNYQTMALSWQEKRDDIDAGITALPEALRMEAVARLAALAPREPRTDGMQVHDAAQPLVGKHYSLRMDPQSGAVVSLVAHGTGNDLASVTHSLALLTYQTLSAEEYAAYQAAYLKTHADWAPKDFGKPGIEAFGAVSQQWHPRVRQCWSARGAAEDRLVVELAMDDAAALATGNTAWPTRMYYEWTLPHAVPQVELTVSTFGKVANRMPEAMWLGFRPRGSGMEGGLGAEAWTLEKVDAPVGALDVIRGGGRSMHAVTNTVTYRPRAGGGMVLRTLDAPLVAVGECSPLNFSLEQPTLAGGVHVGLFNNAWGTNYIQWASGDWRYRFVLEGV